MRLIVTLSEAMFASREAERHRVATGGDPYLAPFLGRIEVIEVRQDSGLLTLEYPASIIDAVHHGPVISSPGKGPCVSIHPRRTP